MDPTNNYQFVAFTIIIFGTYGFIIISGTFFFDGIIISGTWYSKKVRKTLETHFLACLIFMVKTNQLTFRGLIKCLMFGSN
jgi:hypothetical protein